MTGSVVVPDAVEVGQRLRRMRREQQLSQSELGGVRFTGSYVSHVEKGRRRLSGEMIEYFALRLGVTAAEISTGQPPSEVVGGGPETDRMLASQEVQRAFSQHQFARAVRAADEAVREAQVRGDVAEAWAMGMMRAKSLFEDDHLLEAADAAFELADQPLARRLPHLTVEALLLASRSARAGGDLVTGLDRAERAATLVSQVGSTDLQAEAHAVHVGSLMEADQLDRAQQVSKRLAAMIDEVESDQIRGLSHWTVGNVEFLNGDPEEGMRHHAAAARLLHPEVDLRIWGRFRKASATVRLQNSMTDGVLELLHQAGDALRIVGNPSDLTELRLAEAQLRLLQGELDRARVMVEYCLDDESLAHAAHSRAEAEGLLGDIESAAGRPRDASGAYLRSALKFEEAGAYRRSVQMWRRHAAVVG